MGKHVDKAGMTKRYFKAILIAASGLIVMIVGISLITKKDYTASEQVFGLIFIGLSVFCYINAIKIAVTAKKDNTYYSSNSQSSSSSVSTSSNDKIDWDNEFIKAFSHAIYASDMYVKVSDEIVDVEINGDYWTGKGPEADAKEKAYRQERATKEAQEIFKQVAKRCPKHYALHIIYR